VDNALLTQLRPIIDQALAEDVGSGDVTSRFFLAPDAQASLQMRARQPLVLAGVELAAEVFRTLEPKAEITLMATDGQQLQADDALLRVQGNARALLTAERTALNLCQRASAVATVTRAYVDAVVGTKAVILDTRKTMPGLRLLDKYAVACGGGQNHRMGLWDMVLVKDNHIAIAGSISNALDKVRTENALQLPVVVECDTHAQLQEVLAYVQTYPGVVTRVLMDNMTPEQLAEAVALSAGVLPIEASGNMTLERVADVARAGVDYISVGRLTHSALAVDIGLDVTL
jgi:nicotinate-nucleotide pyrophosphorylase (carboxylating)